MGNLIVIAAVVFAFWWLSKKGVKFNLSFLSRYAKTIGGAALLAVGALLLARGQFMAAVFPALLGASFLGWDVMRLLGISGATRVSRFHAPFLDLEVDNLTQHMDGVIKSGKYAGQRLSQMSESAIQEVLNSALRKKDHDSAGLLEAYLYRRFSSGREHAERDANARSSRVKPGAITEQEAYDILGLKPGASTDEIKGAYRTLMKKLHPDLGGTAYLAARVNEAKDVLLNHHR